MQGLKIREMLLSDLDEVLDIEQISFPTPWSRRSFIAELTENVYAHYVVAEYEGRVIGHCGMWVIIDEAHITNVAVRPEFRGRGIGTKILKDMMERAKSRGALRMTLEVRVSNHSAQSLYKHLGFVQRGMRRGYYSDTGEDAIVMWLDDLGPARTLSQGVQYK